MNKKEELIRALKEAKQKSADSRAECITDKALNDGSKLAYDHAIAMAELIL